MWSLKGHSIIMWFISLYTYAHIFKGYQYSGISHFLDLKLFSLDIVTEVGLLHQKFPVCFLHIAITLWKNHVIFYFYI